MKQKQVAVGELLAKRKSMQTEKEPPNSESIPSNLCNCLPHVFSTPCNTATVLASQMAFYCWHLKVIALEPIRIRHSEKAGRSLEIRCPTELIWPTRDLFCRAVCYPAWACVKFSRPLENTAKSLLRPKCIKEIVRVGMLRSLENHKGLSSAPLAAENVTL